jgi:CDP-diacylglycerol--glycerol-3-phosphate 3-phosphatidyltransferase
MTTANKITIFRILMIPVFVMMVIYYGKGVQRGEPAEWQRVAAIATFLLAAASDAIDGFIARRFNQRSQLGLVLDPIADKGLMIAAVVTLSISRWNYEFPIWFPVLVISRDAVILVGSLLVHYLAGGVEIRPSFVGKTATALQMTAIALVLLQLNFFSHPFSVGHLHFRLDFLDLPVGLAGLFTFLSGIGYVMAGLRQLQAGGHTENGSRADKDR